MQQYISKDTINAYLYNKIIILFVSVCHWCLKFNGHREILNSQIWILLNLMVSSDRLIIWPPRRMPQNITDNKSILVRHLPLHHQTASHYPVNSDRFYVAIRPPQRVELGSKLKKMHSSIYVVLIQNTYGKIQPWMRKLLCYGYIL